MEEIIECIVESTIYNDINDESYLSIKVTWDFYLIKIYWQEFDNMDFQWFFDFFSKINENESCHIGYNGWKLNHEKNSDYCIINYNTPVILKIKTSMIIDAMNKICAEIKAFQIKYPNQTSF